MVRDRMEASRLKDRTTFGVLVLVRTLYPDDLLDSTIQHLANSLPYSRLRDSNLLRMISGIRNIQKYGPT